MKELNMMIDLKGIHQLSYYRNLGFRGERALVEAHNYTEEETEAYREEMASLDHIVQFFLTIPKLKMIL